MGRFSPSKLPGIEETDNKQIFYSRWHRAGRALFGPRVDGLEEFALPDAAAVGVLDGGHAGPVDVDHTPEAAANGAQASAHHPSSARHRNFMARGKLVGAIATLSERLFRQCISAKALPLGEINDI